MHWDYRIFGGQVHSRVEIYYKCFAISYLNYIHVHVYMYVLNM